MSLAVAGAMAAGNRPRVREMETAAMDAVRRAVRLCPSVFLAFSLGKDSAVMLDLALRAGYDGPVRVLAWEGETDALHSDWRDVLAAWEARGVRTEVVTARRDSLVTGDTERWDALWGGAEGVLMGLRADESRGRRMTLRTHGTEYRAKNGAWRFCPLAWWKNGDVADYVRRNGLPTLRAYEAHGLEDSRTALRVPREGVRGEAMNDLRGRDPAGYRALCLRFGGTV